MSHLSTSPPLSEWQNSHFQKFPSDIICSHGGGWSVRFHLAACFSRHCSPTFHKAWSGPFLASPSWFPPSEGSRACDRGVFRSMKYAPTKLAYSQKQHPLELEQAVNTSPWSKGSHSLRVRLFFQNRIKQIFRPWTSGITCALHISILSHTLRLAG